MVEVYFNAQSNNGTLTDSELIQVVMGVKGLGMLLLSSERARPSLGTVSRMNNVFKEAHLYLSCDGQIVLLQR